jgi:hypothetical protein
VSGRRNSPPGRCGAKGKDFAQACFFAGTKSIEKSLVITVRKERTAATRLITGRRTMVQAWRTGVPAVLTQMMDHR